MSASAKHKQAGSLTRVHRPATTASSALERCRCTAVLEPWELRPQSASTLKPLRLHLLWELSPATPGHFTTPQGNTTTHDATRSLSYCQPEQLFTQLHMRFQVEIMLVWSR